MWSPRRLAELAGTSRRTVRHYDEIGLLPKPHRDLNGYGQYGVSHLIRLLRIRRMTEWGLSLPQISVVGDADRPPESMMRELDADLAVEIERIQRVRADLSAVLITPGPIDLPDKVQRRTAGLPAAERTLVVVLSRILDAPGFDAYLALLAPYRDNAAVHVFDHLALDADSDVRAETVRGLTMHVHDIRSRYPDEWAMLDRALRRGSPPGQRTVDEVLGQLYNSAQLDVLMQLRAARTRAQGQHLRPPGRPRRQLAASH